MERNACTTDESSGRPRRAPSSGGNMWTNWLENMWHEFVDISRNQLRWFTCTRCGRDGFRKIDDADLLPEEREIKERAEKHFRDHPEMYASVVTFNIRTGAAITTRVFGAEDEY